jgi:cyanophycin synthetase
MHIIEQRFLRGPNLYNSSRSLMTVLEFAADAPALLHARLVRLLPELETHAVDAMAGALLRRLRDGATTGVSSDLPYILTLVQRELQRLAGAPTATDRTHAVRGMPGRYRLVCGYHCEAVAAEAMTLAIALLEALLTNRPFELSGPLTALRATAARQAPDPQMAEALEAAAQADIPVFNVGDDASEFQLGWGSRQRRLRAEDAASIGPDALYALGDGRIPVIAVTGTNGKTTTALMLAHGIQQSGLRCGLTTTEGVFVNGERLSKGDCSGYWSARKVLMSPEVDVAVLETARGGILKRGLAFDRCDIAIVLNVSADHLGLDGIDTVRDLARVKAVVARTAAGAVVLNAEDPHCAAVRRRVRPGVELLYFSLDPEHPVLLRHLDQGGRAAYLQDGALVLADGTRRHALLRADAMPAALGGHARYNIANGLAVAAAMLAGGFTRAQTAAGLASFVSDNRSNPLRSNVFQLPDSGITLIVDYAHNPAAYTALGQAARSLAGGRVLGVITAPGDRRDVDLRDVGRVCAAYFDGLIVYESARRGRDAGETGALIVDGIARAGGMCRQWRQIDDVRAALDQALAQCQAGDVLVYACPSTLEMLAAALQTRDPGGAALVALAAGLELAAP